jgi:hypothetical protein
MADRAAIRASNDFVPFGRLHELLVQQETWQNEVEQLAGSADDEVDEIPDDSLVYEYLRKNNGFETYTNLTFNAIEDIWCPLNGLMGQYRHRGPEPFATSMDHLLLFLMFDENCKHHCHAGQNIQYERKQT